MRGSRDSKVVPDTSKVTTTVPVLRPVVTDGKFLPPDRHQAQPVGLGLLHELPSDLAKRCSQCRVDKVN